VARTFTSRAVIAELALLLNRLPGMLPTAFNCPNVAVGSSRPPSPYRVVFHTLVPPVADGCRRASRLL